MRRSRRTARHRGARVRDRRRDLRAAHMRVAQTGRRRGRDRRSRHPSTRAAGDRLRQDRSDRGESDSCPRPTASPHWGLGHPPTCQAGHVGEPSDTDMRVWLRELDRIYRSRSATRYLGIIATAGPHGWSSKRSCTRNDARPRPRPWELVADVGELAERALRNRGRVNPRARHPLPARDLRATGGSPMTADAIGRPRGPRSGALGSPVPPRRVRRRRPGRRHPTGDGGLESPSLPSRLQVRGDIEPWATTATAPPSRFIARVKHPT